MRLVDDPARPFGKSGGVIDLDHIDLLRSAEIHVVTGSLLKTVPAIYRHRHAGKVQSHLIKPSLLLCRLLLVPQLDQFLDAGVIPVASETADAVFAEAEGGGHAVIGVRPELHQELLAQR